MAGESTTRRLLRARDAMDRDYACPLDVATLARIALLSPSHFTREFQATFGMSVCAGAGSSAPNGCSAPPNWEFGSCGSPGVGARGELGNRRVGSLRPDVGPGPADVGPGSVP